MNSRSQQQPGRRRGGGYFGTTMDTQTTMPPLDQGGLTGFNGVVFGSSGGNINDLGSGVHESPVLQARPFGSHATDQVSVLQQEIRQLRRTNHQLTSASDARTQAAVRMLGELTARNTELAESDDGTRRKQLMRLLLALLDPASIDSTTDDPVANDSASIDLDAIDDGDSQLAEPGDIIPLPPVCQSPPPIQPTSTLRSGRTRVPGLDNPPSRPASREATSAKHAIDWDTSALREVASQGRVVRPGASGDRYAAESRRAIGSSSMKSFGRQQNLSTPTWRQDYRRASHTSETSPHDATAAKESEPGCGDANGDEPSEKLGALAVALMDPSGNQFEQDAGSRFVLYSPSAGTFQAQTLDALKRGSMTLADIIEASVRLVSLDQLQRDRIAEHESAATSKVPATSDSDGENALHITSVRSRSHPRERTPEPINNGGCFWLDITDPTPDEMASLARVFGIHPLTVEDIMTDDEGRDKFETFAGYNFIVYRTIDFGEDAQSNYEFNRGTEGIATANFCLVLKQSCVLSFHRTRGLCHVPNVVERLRDLVPSTLTMQPVVTPAYIAYALIDDITDTLAPEMRSIELEVDAADELVLILSTNEQADMLQRIGAARRKILTLWRLLQGKPDVVRA
ncbi:CorA metal ion transporter, partial [Coemansia sp. RSA 2524]